MEPPVIGMVAGEPSGDNLGAHLMSTLRRHLPGARFTGIGGPKMQAAGFESIFPMEKLSVLGIVEVLKHLPELVGIRRRLAAHFLKERPSVFIGIDSPDFNLDLELRLKGAGIPTVQYVGPTIWAWRRGRIAKIRRAVSKVLVLFPFEPPLYEQADVPVAFVGHPLADLLAQFPPKAVVREQLRLPASAKVITLLPGSRVSELKRMADLFVATADKIADNVREACFLAPFISRETRELFEQALYRDDSRARNIQVLFGHAHDAMAAADVVLATSGTASLEAAMLKRPLVITYKVAPLTAAIHRRQSYLRWVGMPNILAGESIVPEFLQDEATPDNLAQAVTNLLYDDVVRQRLEDRFAGMLAELQQDNATRAAQEILPLLARATT